MGKIKMAKVSLSIAVMVCSLLSIGVLKADYPAGSSSIKKAIITNNTGYNLRIEVQNSEGKELGNISCQRSSNSEKKTIASDSAGFLVDGSKIIFTRESEKPFVYTMHWDGNQAAVEDKSLNLKIKFERINEKVRIQIEERDIFKTTIEEAVKKTIKEKEAMIKKKIKDKWKKF